MRKQRRRRTKGRLGRRSKRLMLIDDYTSGSRRLRALIWEVVVGCVDLLGLIRLILVSLRTELSLVFGLVGRRPCVLTSRRVVLSVWLGAVLFVVVWILREILSRLIRAAEVGGVADVLR